MSVGRFLQQAAAGNAGEAVYVDDVFSTYLYEGNGTNDSATNQIQNGLDLSGEGGLVWVKKRSGGTTGKSHSLYDTERGQYSRLKSDASDAENINTTGVATMIFNSDGFTVQKDSELLNYNGRPYASWTFRKQPGFFDIVTYTGNGTAGRTVSHNLGSVPGMIVVKRRDANSSAWQVYHRANTASPETDYLALNGTAATTDSADRWNDTAPTSTEFTLGNNSNVNANGGTYVAYLFAHDAQDFGTDSDESIIKCGSFTTDGSGFSTSDIDLGFEPQWLMIKRSAGGISDWLIYDVMRGITPEYESTQKISANTNAFETGSGQVALKSTGFGYKGSTNSTYVYVAIRRPHKPAEEFAATDLFALEYEQGSATANNPVPSGFPVDAFIFNPATITYGTIAYSRLTGDSAYLQTASTAAELTNYSIAFDDNEGVKVGVGGSTIWNGSGANFARYMFRRAPKFFDVVTYTGNGVAGRTVTHNLGVTPEMMIVKRRNGIKDWPVYHSSIGAGGYAILNQTYSYPTNGISWNSTAPTSSVFSVGSNNITNGNADTYIAYLFATVPGISKVGSYTGTGSNVDVNCGFTSGARFVLVKRTDSSGDWYLWDTERGIVAGNDSYLLLNSTAAQVTSTDYIDPLSSGFTITSSAPAALNTSGGTYIFLAIA